MIDEFGFLIHSASLCLLMLELRTYLSKSITETYLLIAVIVVVLVVVVVVVFVPNGALCVSNCIVVCFISTVPWISSFLTLAHSVALCVLFRVSLPGVNYFYLSWSWKCFFLFQLWYRAWVGSVSRSLGPGTYCSKVFRISHFQLRNQWLFR